MKKILFITAIFIYTVSVGQQNTKMDFFLSSKADLYTTGVIDGNLMLPMLIKGNIPGIKKLVQASGGTFKYSYGSIAAIVLPVSALSSFNESANVICMEGAPQRMREMDDSSNVKNHIIQILQGDSPLPQAYTGKGIVIGFIDTGIDYKHADFSDSAGGTRVQYYWDMTQSFSVLYTPLPWGYGQAWNKKQLDNGDGTNAASCNDSHGTNVAGIACGNAKCNGHEMGGCPKSDIIAVAYNFSNQTPTMFTDAVNYIFTCADSLKEPCVLNASLGAYDGSHDDSDLQGEMVDSMIMAKQPGRVFVAAAGNEGVPYHVHDSLTGGDTTFTWFAYDAGLKYADIPIFANQPDFRNIKFKIRCDKVSPGSYTERDTIKTYSTILKFMGSQSTSVYNSHGQRLGVINSYGETYAKGSYSLEFQIAPDSTSYYWGFEATGAGRYDIWDYGSINGVVDLSGLNINPATYPGIKKYKEPDTLETICTSYQCSPHIITVQNYFNRLTYVDCITHSIQKNSNTADVPNAFVYASSRGPTRNYTLMKPDIAAPGGFTLSAYPTCLAACNTSTDSLACHDIDGGTSMASPMVASAAGLYLCKNPTATAANVRYCIVSTAYNDRFTGPASQIPNYNWGYGKLDAFNALTMCGLSDGVASVNEPEGVFILSAYPNPYSLITTITYDFSAIKNFNSANIVVYDIMGKVVKTIGLKANEGSVKIDRSGLPSGIYFYSLLVDGARLKTGKLEVL